MQRQSKSMDFEGLSAALASAVGPAYDVGKMSPALDWLSLAFVLHTRSSAGQFLDAGCGTGIAARAVIERGGHVVAIDPEESLLAQLRACIPAEQHARLTTRTGGISDIEFEDAHFAGVHAAHMFQALTGPSISQALQKMFRWLLPTGKLFVSVHTPAGPRWQAFMPEFSRRKASAARWPGLVEDVRSVLSSGESGWIHLLDAQTLCRELLKAGFAIDEMKSYVTPWNANEVCCAVVASRPAKYQ